MSSERMTAQKAYKRLGIIQKEINAVSRLEKDERIKQAYRKLIRKHHPDKCSRKVERSSAHLISQELNEAYSYLMKTDEHAQEATQLSWLTVMQAELASESHNAIATPDSHKPTVEGFFLSLNRCLYKLEKQYKQLPTYDEYIEKYEGISREQQQKNRDYLLKCIRAAGQISALLKNYIDTKDEQHFYLMEYSRKVQLTASLLLQFHAFGSNQQLVICDSGTFVLAKILSDHLVFLRTPLASFKSTEDLYILSLLDDISDKIRSYHTAILSSITKFYDCHCAYGNCDIWEKLHNPNLQLRDVVSKNVPQEVFLKYLDEGGIKRGGDEGCYELLKYIKDELSRGKFSEGVFNIEHLTAGLYENIAMWQAQIRDAQQYVIGGHCHYPDNVDIFDENTPIKILPRFGVRGEFRNVVVINTFILNEFIHVIRLIDPDFQVQPFFEYELGYSSLTEYIKERDGILIEAGQQNLPADRVKPTGGQLIDAYYQQQLLEGLQENDVLEIKADSFAAENLSSQANLEAERESGKYDNTDSEDVDIFKEIPLKPSFPDNFHKTCCKFLHKSGKWYEKSHYSSDVISEAAELGIVDDKAIDEMTYQANQTKVKDWLKNYYIDQLGIGKLEGGDKKFTRLCEEIINQALRLYAMGKSNKPELIINGLGKAISKLAKKSEEAQDATFDAYSSLKEICEAKDVKGEAKLLYNAIHTRRCFFNPAASASAKAVTQKIAQLEGKEDTSCCWFSSS